MAYFVGTLGNLIPMTWAVDVCRSALLEGEIEVDRFLLLLGSAVVLLPVALGIALLIEAQARNLREDRARITRTEHGIPHITAPDFPSLAYGYAQAFAEAYLEFRARAATQDREERIARLEDDLEASRAELRAVLLVLERTHSAALAGATVAAVSRVRHPVDAARADLTDDTAADWVFTTRPTPGDVNLPSG